MKKVDAGIGQRSLQSFLNFGVLPAKISPLAEWRPIVVNRYRYRESVGIGDVSERAVCLGLLCSTISLIGTVGLLVPAIEPLLACRPRGRIFCLFPAPQRIDVRADSEDAAAARLSLPHLDCGFFMG